MLTAASAPLYLWAEAYAMAVYVRNRVLSSVTPEKPPSEYWFGVRPELSNLRVFGSLAYAYVEDDRRTKMEPGNPINVSWL